MTGYQAVLLAGRSGAGQVIRFAKHDVPHPSELSIVYCTQSPETIELLLRSQTRTSLFGYKAMYSTQVETDGHTNGLPQLEPRGEFRGASSHRCRPPHRLPFVVAILEQGEGARVSEPLQPRRWRSPVVVVEEEEAMVRSLSYTRPCGNYR